MNLNIELPDELHKKLKLQAVKEDSTLKASIIEKLEKAMRRTNVPKVRP